MRRKKWWYFSLSVAILFIAAQAQAGFEVSGKGPRPAAMAGAFTALANDPNAIWFNPAGLAQLQQRQGLLMYARLLPGLDTDKLHNFLAAYVHPLASIGTLGFGWAGLKADIYSENAFSASWAHRLGNRLFFGATAKWLRWSADPYTDLQSGQRDKDFSTSAISLDLGALYDIGELFNYGTLRVGGAVFNLNEPNLSKSDLKGGEIPRTLRGGLLFQTETYLVEVDVVHYRDQTKLVVGLEYKITGPYDFRIRGGTVQMTGDYEGGEFDGGFGVTIKGIIFDYAFLYPSQIRQVGGSHRFSIGYKF